MGTSKLATASSVTTGDAKPATSRWGWHCSGECANMVMFGCAIFFLMSCMGLAQGEDVSPLCVVGGFVAFVVGLVMKVRDFIRTRRAIVGSGVALLRFQKSQKRVFVFVRVNGIKARFLVDTGATDTLISDALAVRANIAATDKESEVRLVNGSKLKVKVGRAEIIMVENANVRNLEIMICAPQGTSWGEEAPGILGMTFLEHFDMRICNGVLELAPLATK